MLKFVFASLDKHSFKVVFTGCCKTQVITKSNQNRHRQTTIITDQPELKQNVSQRRENECHMSLVSESYSDQKELESNTYSKLFGAENVLVELFYRWLVGKMAPNILKNKLLYKVNSCIKDDTRKIYLKILALRLNPLINKFLNENDRKRKLLDLILPYIRGRDRITKLE